VSADTSGTRRLVDERGRTLLDLREARVRFESTAISSDGGLIVGYTGDGWIGESGWARTWLEATDATGTWTVKVEGGEGGEAPQLSREGCFVAFRSGRATRIGRLEVELP